MHRRVGQRRAVLRDDPRRGRRRRLGRQRAKRSARRPAPRWRRTSPTSSPSCTGSTSTPSGSATSPVARATSSARSPAGRSNGTVRRPASLPAVDEVAKQLADRVPAQQGVAVVHGDYRFGNCITDPSTGEIKAVLDWELCTLGDPLADVGYVGAHWAPADGGGGRHNDPTRRRRLRHLRRLRRALRQAQLP